MSKIVLNDVTNLNALSVINDNFDKLEQELQNKVLYRDNPEGEPNGLEGDLDANGNSIFNVQDLTIAGNFSVNGKSIEEVIDAAAADIEANAEAAVNAATAASASASSAATSATSAAASASTATTKAGEASTSASGASTSATSAFDSATSAASSASAANASASSAASSATAASLSASTATTQAGIATTGATTATTQAGIATTKASEASTSATSAANSAAAAATALDSFDDRYLGSKSSDPTVDNDGNALITGALYYNTTSQTMKVYDGANWITATAAGTTAMNVYKYVATAGQTTFSGAAAVGGTMSYTSGNIIVFVNGVSLDSTDYTATNGTSVVLSVAAALNDEVVVVAFKSFTVADTYTQSAADARFLSSTNGSVTQAKLAANVAGNGPAFSAYQSTPQALSSGVFTNVQCQTENFDTGGCFNNTGSTVTLNGISTPAYAFAPNVAGYYQINLHLNCTLASSQELITSIYKNGSSVNYVSDVIGGLTRSSNGSYLIYCNGTSDYIQMYGYINTNATISIAYFQAFMVRAA